MVYGDVTKVFVVFKAENNYSSQLHPYIDIYVSVCQTLDRAKDRAQRTYKAGLAKGKAPFKDKLEWECAQDPGIESKLSWRYVHTIFEEDKPSRRSVVMIVREETVE